MIKYLRILPILLIFGCSHSHKTATTNEWIKLFNGKDINDWVVKIYHHDAGVNFGNTFRVENGMVEVRYDQYDHFNDQFGHLFYKVPFSHFHLKFDYRFVGEWRTDAPSYTNMNSGMMFHSQDPYSIRKEQNWPISIEMQLLGGLGDGKPRPTGNMCSPGTDIVYNGKKYDEHCLSSSSKTYEKNVWVHAELIVLGDSLVTHIINGDTVLQYSKPSIGGGIVTGYDSTVFQSGKPLTSGFIALQSEGQPIDFKNIELKKLQ